jgi:hypothetical protein|tara:strand:+ start:1108 stop:1623 length:516 start_codon:yes stop_codon:yes gene_type:complete
MGLLQVATTTVSGTPTTVQILGTTTTDAVYLVAMNNVRPTTDDKDLFCRVTTSGTADSSSEYDYAYKQLRADTTFGNTAGENESSWRLEYAIGNVAGEEMFNGLMYLYNFNNSSEYSYMTLEGSNRLQAQNLLGETGGGVQTEAQSCNGLEFFWESSSTFASGTFTLYEVT